MKNKLAPKIIIFTIFIFLFSTIGQPFFALANSSNPTEDFDSHFFGGESQLDGITITEFERLTESELIELGINVEEGFDEFNEEILRDDFDFEAAVENLDIFNMDDDEKETFLKIIQEVAATSGTEEVELLEESLINLFDSSSETFSDLEAAQEELIENYIEKVESESSVVFTSINKFVFGAEKVHASNQKKGKVRVGVYFTAAAINTLVGGVVGGGFSAIKNFIKKKGKNVAHKELSRVATAAALKLQIKQVRGVAIATVMSSAVTFALNYLDFGYGIAHSIDLLDWYPNNDWIDITK
ncbi:hypothetical protein [Sutcliffiella halmapala]|uniref:hypothetical protein n=1 Tax=Sutcliffiella halmapala TaxID=79882 RepID=UPI0009950FE9|nr:hypothetical protein [Sutcliffiella halmapala]